METSQLDWIDTHCHLYATEFDADCDEIIREALTAGVSRIMMPNIDLESIPRMLKLAELYPDHCRPMIGLHPCSVKADYRDHLETIRHGLSGIHYTGIGETGIDLYWDTTFKKEQIDAFEQQISWAKDLDLPVIIHSRESLELNIEIISHHQDGHLRGIFHCFSGTVEQVKRIADLGFKLGIGGVATFKKAGLAELLPSIPLDLIVLETDAPYLAPVPYRGKRNEPAYLALIGKFISEVLNRPPEEISRITCENARSVFRNMG